MIFDSKAFKNQRLLNSISVQKQNFDDKSDFKKSKVVLQKCFPDNFGHKTSEHIGFIKML